MVFSVERLECELGAHEPALPPHQSLQKGNALPAAGVIKANLNRRRIKGLAVLQDSLRQRMPHPVGIGIFHPLAHAIWARIDRFFSERITQQREGMAGRLKLSVWLKEELRCLPEPRLKAIERIGAGNAYSFDDFLVKVVEQL